MMRAVTDNREPVVSGREGRHSLEVIEALYRSANENRAVML
jgi:predicted dehydrogenase